MLINFRQGIVQSATPFLQYTSAGVNINAVNAPLVLTIAHGNSNYLVTVEDTVLAAWAWAQLPVMPAWLYVDIHPGTGVISYGATSVKPVSSGIPPTQPAADQHWFDLSTTKTKVFTNGSWIEKIRIVVGKVSSRVSVRGYTVGSVVELNDAAAAGKVVFDSSGFPVRKSNGELFTTEDQIYVNGAISAPNTLEPRLFTIIAQESIPEGSFVTLTEFGQVRLATHSDIGTKVVGYSRYAIPATAAGTIITYGLVENAKWDWAAPNQPVYITNSGVVSSTPIGTEAPIGRSVSPTTVSFELAGSGTGGGGSGTPGINGLSAYQVAVANGFTGTELQWLSSLRGPAGAAGASGPTGPAGASGPTGPAGAAGLSAYQTAVANGFVGTEVQWLASLQGSSSQSSETTATGTTIAPIILDTFAIASYRSGDYMVTVSSASGFSVSKLLVLHTDIAASFVSYGLAGTVEGTFSTSIVGGNVVLSFTPSVAGVEVKIIRTLTTNSGVYTGASTWVFPSDVLNQTVGPVIDLLLGTGVVDILTGTDNAIDYIDTTGGSGGSGGNGGGTGGGTGTGPFAQDLGSTSNTAIDLATGTGTVDLNA